MRKDDKQRMKDEGERVRWLGKREYRISNSEYRMMKVRNEKPGSILECGDASHEGFRPCRRFNSADQDRSPRVTRPRTPKGVN